MVFMLTVQLIYDNLFGMKKIIELGLKTFSLPIKNKFIVFKYVKNKKGLDNLSVTTTL